MPQQPKPIAETLIPLLPILFAASPPPGSTLAIVRRPTPNGGPSTNLIVTDGSTEPL